jgi:hypothetical protein
MKKFLVVLFVAGLLAAALFAQGASADGPHCILGGCLQYDGIH